jgi:hypothetical protein
VNPQAALHRTSTSRLTPRVALGTFAILAMSVLAMSVAGCGPGISLTDRGSRVAYLPGNDLPEGCQLVGDVAIGIPPDAARPSTEDQLVILMRNKAGEYGASHVAMDQSERREGAGNRIHYVGRGRAYTCREGAAIVEPREPGSAPAGEAGGETSGATTAGATTAEPAAATAD